MGVVHLSRHHARLKVTPDGLSVEDLDSSNGTFVNGKKIASAILLPGDELSFDTLKFRINGPEMDDDRTTVRPKADAEQTTVRPALNLQAGGGQVTPSAAAQAAKSNKPRPNTGKAHASSPSKANTAPSKAAQAVADDFANVKAIDPEAGGGGKIIAALLVVMVIGVAAWYFMM